MDRTTLTNCFGKYIR